MENFLKMRIVSLLPSATEIVASVGGLPYLVGRSHECNFPTEVLSLPILTGAKNAFVNSRQMNDAVNETLASGEGLYYVNEDLLRDLAPDVIVTQSLCAVCSVDFNLINKVAKKLDPIPLVIDLNPQNLTEVIEGCLQVGEALNLQVQAQETVLALNKRVEAMKQIVQTRDVESKPSVAFLEWTDPIFVGGHWTPQLIHMAGACHPLNPPKSEGEGAGYSYAISNEDFVASDPDWIIICPCGLNIEETFKEMKSIKDQSWWTELRAVKLNQVVFVDGDQMFNRPGPRLVDALEWLTGLFQKQQELIPTTFPWKKYKDFNAMSIR